MRATTWVGMGWLALFGVGCASGIDAVQSDDTAYSDDEPTDGTAELHARRSPVERLGKLIFFDENLSRNKNQSCAACHARSVGWTGPDEDVNLTGAVYEASIPGRFGNRKPPASAYATIAPVFTLDAAGVFVGGNFWDGRATGWVRGNPAADQATGPFLNPVEQALPDAETLVGLVCKSHYSKLFRRVFGRAACRNVDRAFDQIAFSIAAFEDSSEVNAFTSKFDAFVAGRTHLDERERLGLALFRGKARCNNCHTADGTAGKPAAFTDFTYDNLGVPRNPENPFYEMDTVLVDGSPINPLGEAFVDQGLGGFLASLASNDDWRSYPHVTEPLRSTSSADLRILAAANRGKQKVPTLRNVDRRPHAGMVKAYTHNGYFKSLESLVHFYNTRDTLPRCPGDLTDEQATAQGCWPAPEVSDNINTTELGHLGLSADEEGALVAFMRTLSDGFKR